VPKDVQRALQTVVEGEQTLSDEAILHRLRETNLLDTIVQDVAPTVASVPAPAQPEALEKTAGPTSVRAWPTETRQSEPRARVSGSLRLRVSVNSARAFVNEFSPEEGGSFYLAVCFDGAVFRTASVPARPEPDLSCDLTFDLPQAPVNLVTCSQQIQLVVVRQSHAKTVVGTQTIEWRYALAEQEGVVATVELIGHATPGSVGILTVRLGILADDGYNPNVTAADVEKELVYEKGRFDTAVRNFLATAGEMWREFVELDPRRHPERHVHLYTQNEARVDSPLCSFVQHLATEQLSSPAQALRFVSLLSDKNPVHAPRGSTARWQSLLSTLQCAQGSLAEKAILLCSLLLGFGFDAYVAVGRLRNNDHERFFVVTLSCDQLADIWDVEAGDRFSSTRAPPGSTIECAFNDTGVLLNIQRNPDVTACTFDFTPESHFWMGLFVEPHISQLFAPSPGPDLVRDSMLDTARERRALEESLMHLVQEHRERAKLAETKFSDKLSFVLRTGLVCFEQEAVDGQPPQRALDDFYDSVKRQCKTGETFSGIPICANHLHAPRLLEDILGASGGEAALDRVGGLMGLACHIEEYPEGVMSVWVFVGAIGRTGSRR
jgi:centrosomal protein CEP76